MVDAAGGRIGHGLVDGIGQDRLQVAHEHREELGQHGLGAAALKRARLFAVQTVLQGVEVHVGELGNHEVVERTVGARKLVAGVGIVDLGLDLGQTGNHELVERQQVGKGDAVGLGLKLALELGKQEAQRVAETTVGIGRTSENLVVDGNVGAGVDGGNPQTDDVGAHLVADLVGVNDVAERLGHLAALAVERKALRDDGLVRSMAVGTHRGEQRALEPTAVLVGALEVNVRRVLKLGAILADGLPGNAGVPPHVENVLIGLEVMATALGADACLAQVALGSVGEPGVGALLVKELDDGVERSVVHNLLAAVGAGVARNRHAPVALTADAPVGTLLDHGADAVGGMGRIPLDVLADLLASLLAQAGLVHRDEPLVGCTEEHRVLAAPAVRIAVRDLLLEDQGAALAQELDDVRVGLIGIHAAEGAAGAKLLAGVELAVVIDRHADVGDALLEAGKVVVNAVAGRVVDDTGTVIDTDVIGQQRHPLNTVEDRLLVVDVVEGLGGNHVGLAVNHDRGVLPAKLLTALGSQVLEHDLGATIVLNGDVSGAGLEGNCLVGRDGPRGGRPDDEVDQAVEVLEAGRLGGHLKANEDRGARLVGVLDLGLGQRGVAVLAPVNRLVTAIDHALIEHGLEDLDVGGIMLVIERQIGVVPVAEHTQTAEAGLLELDVLDSELVAELTNLGRGGLVELLGAELLLDLMLDRLAMAVPTRDIGNLIALHHPVTVDHVLGDLVHGVADVDRAVGVRRTVVQHELLVTLVLLQNLLVDLVVLPVLESLGLGLGKTGTHGKTGLGQIHRLLVLVCHGTPFMSWARTPVGHQKGARPYKLGRSATKRAVRPQKLFA